jgi:hypothetical protein
MYILERENIYVKTNKGTKGKLFGTYTNGLFSKVKHSTN